MQQRFDVSKPPATRASPDLKRVLGLPLLVFYGLGVTVGAGIFALIGEILGLAGDHAPLAFLIAGIVAAGTARAFALLSRRYPRAAGEALYATHGFGPLAGRLAGFGVTATGIISSAVISLAFANYVGTLVPFPTEAILLVLMAGVALVATIGVKESVMVAATITILEVGTLVIVASAGAPSLFDATIVERLTAPPATLPALELTMAAAAVAFFAFIGFEDIVNMAEETPDPERNLGAAIAITLAVTVVLYATIAAIAAAAPDRAAIVDSPAPLADLFAQLTGASPVPISVMAAIAMINGILVQVVMASRVVYGMAREGLLPGWLGAVHPKWRTPLRATAIVTAIIVALSLAAPLLTLARTSGYVTLFVFALVNLSLFRIASRPDWPGHGRQRLWGLLGAALAGGLLAFEIVRQLSGD
jgi:basic amino acid/polyamine antiporter, APA family